MIDSRDCWSCYDGSNWDILQCHSHQIKNWSYIPNLFIIVETVWQEIQSKYFFRIFNKLRWVCQELLLHLYPHLHMYIQHLSQHHRPMNQHLHLHLLNLYYHFNFKTDYDVHHYFSLQTHCLFAYDKRGTRRNFDYKKKILINKKNSFWSI